MKQMENKNNKEQSIEKTLFVYLKEKWFHTQRDLVEAILNNAHSKYNSWDSLETLISKVLNHKRLISDQLFICLESVLFPDWQIDINRPNVFTNHTRETIKNKYKII